jgi:hypothetical protein
VDAVLVVTVPHRLEHAMPLVSPTSADPVASRTGTPLEIYAAEVGCAGPHADTTSAASATSSRLGCGCGSAWRM